ncbi:MAG: hypothetical protein ACLRFE_04125 [Clostridia bacterium]
MVKSKIRYRTGKVVVNNFKKLDLCDTKVVTQPKCLQIYNFDNSKGVLKNGMGIQSLHVHYENDINSPYYELDYNILGLEYYNKVMYFKQYFASNNLTTHRLLFHGSDGKIYLFQMFYGLTSANWLYDLKFDLTPMVLDYKKGGLDSILISDGTKLVVWTTGRTPYEVKGVPTITSMCVHDDVLYCTIAGDSEKIWYTSNLDPECVGVETEETKYLVLDTEAGGGQKIIEFDNNVYLFCDYGICKITTYAKREPTYSQIYLSNGKIYSNTVVACGDYVLFVTRDGLYSFNGSVVIKIGELKGLFDNAVVDYATATTLNNNYYLALRINYEDDVICGCESNPEFRNNALIKVDLKNYDFEIMRGVDIKNMMALKAGVEEKVIVTFNSTHCDKIGEIVQTGEVFNEVLSKVCTTNEIICEDMNPVTIRKIKVDSSKDVQFKIITDKDKVIFNATKSGINEFQTIIPCQKFKIEIISNAKDAYVNLVEIEYVKAN